MKTNKETLKTAMDRRLSFLDGRPSCRAAVLHRIAQEEEPVMKRKISVGFVFAMVLVLLTVAALAAGLLISPKVSASRAADRALEEQYGVTADMQTFFYREETQQDDGTLTVTWTGMPAMNLEYVLGTYTAAVKDGKAAVTWSREGADLSGGYEADAWGPEQLKQMIADSAQPDAKHAFEDKAKEIAAAHGVAFEEDNSPSVEDIGWRERREAAKTAALEARVLAEEEMAAIAREFVITSYELNDEQAGRLEMYTELAAEEPNTWYETVNGKPCFEVEFLLYAPYTVEMMDSGETPSRTEKDGYYRVFVNVETGAVEDVIYNSALAGEG